MAELTVAGPRGDAASRDSGPGQLDGHPVDGAPAVHLTDQGLSRVVEPTAVHERAHEGLVDHAALGDAAAEALEAYVAMWPPTPSSGRFARETMIAAFHRMNARIRRSMCSSPGNHGSASGGIVLM